MIALAAIAVATIAACEIALRSPLVRSLGQLTGTSRKAASVVSSGRVSDHWKERVLPAYALRIFSSSLWLLGCLLALAAPVVVAASLLTGSLAAGSAYLVTALPLLVMLFVGVGWIWLRRRVLA
ncbi:MAG: hypothetical protein AAF566_01860 [Pseudomonadota bacterium]